MTPRDTNDSRVEPALLIAGLLGALVLVAAAGYFLYATTARSAAVARHDAALAEVEEVRSVAALDQGILSGELAGGDVLMLPEYGPVRHRVELERLARRYATESEAFAAPLDEPGTPLVIEGRVVDTDGAPLAGAQVYAYQTDAHGWYGVERSDDEANARLWSFCTTDADGAFRIQTIRPGHYAHDPSVPAHVHFDARAEGFGRPAGSGPPSLFFEGDPMLDDAQRAEIASDGATIAAVTVDGDGVERCSIELRLARTTTRTTPRPAEATGE